MHQVTWLTVLIVVVLLGTGYCAAPTFDKPPQSGGNGSVAENAVVGSVIMTLQATDIDGNVLTFKVEKQTPDYPVFTINGNDGLIVPSGLDADSGVTTYYLRLSVTDGTSTDSTTYNLTIIDVNDEAPVFTQLMYTSSVVEVAPAGTVITTVSATDPDHKKEPITYSIHGAQTFFQVDSSGVITVTGSGDLEPSNVTLIITASDGQLTGTASVFVQVLVSPCTANPCSNGGTCAVLPGSETDRTCMCLYGYLGNSCQRIDYCAVNYCQHDGFCSNNEADTSYECTCTADWTGTNCTDARLAFTYPMSGSESSIDENKMIGGNILRLEANNQDRYKLTFGIVNQAPPKPRFSLQNGILLVPPGLDAEKTTVFTFIFSVSDGSSIATSKFTLHIADVNDNPPMFDRSEYSTLVMIGSKTTTDVLTVSAYDPDVSRKPIKFRILGSDSLAAFEISSSGHITLVNAARLARAGMIELTVQAFDGGLSAKVNVIIKIDCCKNNGICRKEEWSFKCSCIAGFAGDKCENAVPIFKHPNSSGFEASIYENTIIGKGILRLEASDSDSDKLAFGIFNQAPPEPRFILHNGILLAPPGLDAEKTTLFTFIFSAFDGTSTVTSGKFTLHIRDINDNQPKFNRAVYSARVMIGNEPTDVLTVSAYDPDVSRMPISYQLQGSDSSAAFQISSSGHITLVTAPKLAPAGTIVLTVQASDGGLSAEVPVFIEIERQNQRNSFQRSIIPSLRRFHWRQV